MTMKAIPRRARPVAAVLLAATMFAAACSDDQEASSDVAAPRAESGTETESGTGTAAETGDDGAGDDERDPYVTDSWYTGADLGTGVEAPQGPLGSENPEIGTLPEEIPTTPFPAVEPDNVVVIESYGQGQGAAHLVDMAEGSLGYINVATGADIWMPTGGEELPLAVASVERFRPRGARGEIQAVVTFWNPEGNVANEILLPRYQYPSAGAQTPQMTPDGRHLIVNDRLIPGFLLIDVEAREVVAELPLEPTCFARLYVADAETAYAVCWESGEVVEIAIGDGTLEEVGRAVAFEPGTPVLEDAVFSPESGLLTIFTRFSEVLPVDLSGGLPTAPVDPVDLTEAGHIIRTGQNYLTPDGARAVVGYVEGDNYAGGDPVVWRVFDTSTWTEAGRLTFGDNSPESLLPTQDSTGMYVLTNGVEVPVEGGEADETEEVTVLSIVDLATGGETARTEIEPTTGSVEFTSIYVPVVIAAGS